MMTSTGVSLFLVLAFAIVTLSCIGMTKGIGRNRTVTT
jgi:hypothetical protein